MASSTNLQDSVQAMDETVPRGDLLMGGWERTGPVVVEVDGSAEGLRVIDYACTEAMRFGVGLVLVAAYPARGPQDVHQPWQTPERVGEFLRIAAAHVRRQVGQALQVTLAPAEGARAKVLSGAARDARLLVVGRARRRGPERLIAARANLALARRSDCPLVVVPGSWKLAPGHRDVAVGIDGTALSSEAVEFAFQAAAERQGNLIAVHAVRRPLSPDGSWVREGDLALTEVLARSAADYPEVQVTRYLTNRPVVAALVHKAHEVGLVVLGAHAGRLPIGDPVARRAMVAVATPVAIVPHKPTAYTRRLR